MPSAGLLGTSLGKVTVEALVAQVEGTPFADNLAMPVAARAHLLEISVLEHAKYGRWDQVGPLLHTAG